MAASPSRRRDQRSGKNVLEARRAITDQALEMAARGEIELSPVDSDETYFR